MTDESCGCGCATKPGPIETTDERACGCECCGDTEPKDAVA